MKNSAKNVEQCWQKKAADVQKFKETERLQIYLTFLCFVLFIEYVSLFIELFWLLPVPSHRKISGEAFLCCSVKCKNLYFTQLTSELEMLTCGCGAATYVVIFVIELDSHPFAVASRHSTAAAPAQGDRDNSIDVSQHDRNTDTYTAQCKNTQIHIILLQFQHTNQLFRCQDVSKWNSRFHFYMALASWYWPTKEIFKMLSRDRWWRRDRDEGKHFFLTNSDCCDHGRHNHRQRHPTSYYQVPLVFGDVLAFITIMDLRRKTFINNLKKRDQLHRFSNNIVCAVQKRNFSILLQLSKFFLYLHLISFLFCIHAGWYIQYIVFRILCSNNKVLASVRS